MATILKKRQLWNGRGDWSWYGFKRTSSLQVQNIHDPEPQRLPVRENPKLPYLRLSAIRSSENTYKNPVFHRCCKEPGAGSDYDSWKNSSPKVYK